MRALSYVYMAEKQGVNFKELKTLPTYAPRCLRLPLGLSDGTSSSQTL